jgi:hypothetical protein
MSSSFSIWLSRKIDVKIWPGDIDLWPWKSIGFQTLLRTKYVPSLVKINFARQSNREARWHMGCLKKNGSNMWKRIWNPLDFQGQRSRSQGLIFRWGDTPCFALPLSAHLTRRVMWAIAILQIWWKKGNNTKMGNQIYF